jgi:hypothetical protein
MLVNPKKLEEFENPFKGLFHAGLNADFELWGSNGPYNQVYFNVDVARAGGYDIYSYGVVDSLEQFHEKFGKAIDADTRPIAVTFCHIEKDVENAGNGGGWRWHKWGEYLGDGRPTTEYLDDEELFDNGVFVYHMYDVTGLEYE